MTTTHSHRFSMLFAAMVAAACSGPSGDDSARAGEAGAAAAGQAAQDITSTGELLVYRIPVRGVIEFGVAPYIERSLAEAEAGRAVAAVLDIETPGGRIDAAQRIVNALVDAEVPVYAFVNHRALSAGAMIALATDGIYMREGSVIGAATPVTGEGERASEKIVSVMRSEMRTLADAHGLDPRVAEAMVDEEIAIEGVVEEGKLLTLTTTEAVELGFAEEVADYSTLLAALGYEDAGTVQAEVNWAEGVVRFFTHPMVAPFLLSLGFLGLLIEIKTPTFGVAGAVGLGCIALFFGSHFLVGLAGWEEAILLGAGVVLLAVEAFVIPGFGVFGIAGVLAVLAGVFLSFVGEYPTTADYGQAAVSVSAVGLIALGILWLLILRLPHSKRLARSGILLGGSTSRDTGYLSQDERPDLVGAEGVALTDLRPAGAGRFGTERVDVVAEDGWIEDGTPIRIVRSEGYRNVVRPAG